MRKFLLSLVVLISAPSSWASISVNATNIDTNITATTSFSRSVTSTVGNLYVIAVVGGANNQNLTVTASDNKSNTYVQTDSNARDANSPTSYIFYAKAPTTAVTQFTISIASGTSQKYTAVFWDLSGADTTAPLEAHAILQNQTATTNPVGPSVTPSTNGGFAVAAIGPQGNATAVGSPFTGDTFDSNTGAGIAHNAYATAGNLNPSWTQSSSGTWDAVIAAFKPSGIVPKKPPVVL
jgi:hypothetical protein